MFYVFFGNRITICSPIKGSKTSKHLQPNLSKREEREADIFNEMKHTSPNYNSMFTTETFCKYFGLGEWPRESPGPNEDF